MPKVGGREQCEHGLRVIGIAIGAEVTARLVHHDGTAFQRAGLNTFAPHRDSVDRRIYLGSQRHDGTVHGHRALGNPGFRQPARAQALFRKEFLDADSSGRFIHCIARLADAGTVRQAIRGFDFYYYPEYREWQYDSRPTSGFAGSPYLVMEIGAMAGKRWMKLGIVFGPHHVHNGASNGLKF